MSGIIAATNLAVASTNALLNFLLPQVTQFAQRADLPEKTATVADVREYGEVTKGYYLVTFKNGDIYRLYPSYVQSFESPHSIERLLDPKLISKFYGPLNVTESDAIDLARQTIRKLGYTEEMLYADLKPMVHTDTPMNWTNIFPDYLITWPTPNQTAFSKRSAEFEINGTTGEIEKVWFMNDNLKRDTILPPGFQPEVYETPGRLLARTSWQLMSDALPQVNDFAHALNLWPTKITNTNQVKICEYFHVGPVVYGRIELTNGFSFRIFEDKAVGFSAPDEFFRNSEVRVKDFVGKWKITQADAVALARKQRAEAV